MCYVGNLEGLNKSGGLYFSKALMDRLHLSFGALEGGGFVLRPALDSGETDLVFTNAFAQIMSYILHMNEKRPANECLCQIGPLRLYSKKKNILDVCFKDTVIAMMFLREKE